MILERRSTSMTLRKARHAAALSFATAMGAFVLSAAATVPAHADFRVCNATQNLVGVAIGYRAKAGWVTEGWWHIEGSSCKTLIEGPLSSRFYYLYGTTLMWKSVIMLTVGAALLVAGAALRNRGPDSGIGA